MRLRSEQLPAHLNKSLATLYCVHGDEILLVQEACDSIRRQARIQHYSQREIHQIEGRFDWDELLQSSRHLSLFAERRLIELRIPSGKPGTEGARALISYCTHLPADTLTLITLPKPDRATSGSKWFTALEQAAVMVGVLPVTIEQLPRWISERLAQQHQHTTPPALRLITEKVEGNLLAAQQEILKLGMLHPAGSLSFEQVQDAVLDVARYDVFKLADALLAGDLPRLIRILHGLKGEGEASTLVLWALTRELRLLRQLAGLTGDALKQAMRKLGVWDNRQSLTERAARRLTPLKLDMALHQAATIDRMMKGLDKRDPWLALEELMIQVAV